MKVAIPVLHISLGTYLKFFRLLEQQCHILDFKLAGTSAILNKKISEEEYNKIENRRIELINLEKQIEDTEETIHLISNAVEIEILKSETPYEEIVNIYEPRIQFFNKKLDSKVIQISN